MRLVHAIAPLLLLLAACASPGVATGPNVDPSGVAISGYDPTTYFEGTPRRGDARFTATHEGSTFLFVDAEHRDRFAADPERFAPEYGGWCAWAVAEGYTYEVDPESYLIQDGRLLLFYAGTWGDTRAQWLESDGAERLASADTNWDRWERE